MEAGMGERLTAAPHRVAVTVHDEVIDYVRHGREDLTAGGAAHHLLAEPTTLLSQNGADTRGFRLSVESSRSS
jgi:hypothetical protein